MEYKNFKIGELFDIHPTKRYDLTNNDLFKKWYDTSYNKYKY